MDMSEARTPSERRFCILESVSAVRALSEFERAELQQLQQNIRIANYQRERRLLQRRTAAA